MKNAKAKAISITMPAEMYKNAESTAKAENRTFSELVREALRRYNWEKDFDQIQSYGRARAVQLGIKEEDVVPLIHRARKEEREKQNKKKKYA